MVLSEFANRPVKAVCGAALLALLGCDTKSNVAGQLSELQRTFPASAALASNAPESSSANQPAFLVDGYVAIAISAFQTNNYAAAVVALQKAERVPGITAQQLMSVQQAIEGLTASLVSRAAAGDARAKSELAQIEKTRSQ